MFGCFFLFILILLLIKSFFLNKLSQCFLLNVSICFLCAGECSLTKGGFAFYVIVRERPFRAMDHLHHLHFKLLWKLNIGNTIVIMLSSSSIGNVIYTTSVSKQHRHHQHCQAATALVGPPQIRDHQQ